MKLALQLSCIIFLSLCFNLYCSEKKYNSDKIIQKSFSTGTSIGKQKALFEEQKRIKHIITVKDCIHAQQLVPTKLIFAADHDITQIALAHNQTLSDQTLRTSK